MKIVCLPLIILLTLATACSKEDHRPDLRPATTVDPKNDHPSTPKSAPTAATIYNPIVGKWELGAYKLLCLGDKDTTIYPNERGDFVEFRKTDTAFYTFHTTNATGWSPYKILDSSRFILGDTMHIISNDGVRLTTYAKSSNGGSQQWMTYKKVAP